MAFLPMECVGGGAIGTRVQITSSDIPYTMPSDGYLYAYNQSAQATASVLVYSGTDTSNFFAMGESTGRFTIPVKAGMKCKLSSNNVMPTQLFFVPLV